MASKRADRGIEELLWAAQAQDAVSQNDGQLLRQFLARRDEAAFAALVKRHGPMVLGVCRRILGNTADAEDAFQAAFIVLVRKAASLTARAVLGDWLHGVARRTALNARRAAARRRVKEKAMARPVTQSEEVRDDRLALLDEALSRLPEKYRSPLVLCELEGWTRREAAERLGWPEGTVAGRLARGRALLAKQLARQGLALSAGTLAAKAAVPASLVSSTIKAAVLIAAGQTAATDAVSASVAALAEGVLKSMLRTKIKFIAGVVLLIVLLGAGGTAGVLAYRSGAAQPEGAPQTADAKGNKEKTQIPMGVREDRLGPAKRALPQAADDEEDRIKPGDILNIRVLNSPPGDPIGGILQVEKNGKVALAYGRVSIKGMTLEVAERAIREYLVERNFVKEPFVRVTRPIPENPALERRVQQLEDEVRALRSAVEELRKKARN